MKTAQLISAKQLAERDDEDRIDLVDVRTPLEFSELHATQARNFPLHSLDPHAVMRARENPENPLYLICKGGARAEKAQRQFIDAGYPNVVNVEGGTEAWVAAGLPVVRGKQVMSLERQVRLTAGFLIFAGAVAALVTGKVIFAAIPAFVGAGLMFAAITNSCAMGLVIAKMPWNQVRADAG